MKQEKPTAIIAEDVPEMGALLSNTLKNLGCTIIAIEENGKSALEKIEALQPDMVFLDIEMPGLTGLEILDEIKTRSLLTFPVIVSGHSNFENLKSSMEKGAKGFIVKPYTPDKVNQMIVKYSKIAS